MKPKALILHATGTNRDIDAAQAFELAGSVPQIVHLNELRQGEKRWRDYQILVLPGGFSYADALGAGKLLALDLKVYFTEEVNRFIESGKPVIGICNGFQALVKSGILPGPHTAPNLQPATLSFNASGHFECRWVSIIPNSTICKWTVGLDEPIECPVAHGEGKFWLRDPSMVSELIRNQQLALLYGGPDGKPAEGRYPQNPNGSFLDIAGICNPQGNVLGLMPHPEDHIFPQQHPNWTSGWIGRSGLPLFQNGVRYAKSL